MSSYRNQSVDLQSKSIFLYNVNLAFNESILPGNWKKKFMVNPFHATDLFLYLLKTSENQRFCDVFRGYRKRSVAWNGLTVTTTKLKSLAEAVVRRCFSKPVHKNFAMFTGKHFCWRLLLLKLPASRSSTLLRRDSNTGAFRWILRSF